MNALLSTQSNKWLSRPVAILGRGESGQAAASLVEHLGGTYQFYSQDVGGDGRGIDKRQAARHALVVFSPGFPAEHPWLQAAREAGCEVLGEIEWARTFWKGQLWTVSGTNGKTTTVRLLCHVLRHAGMNAVEAGNIGHAFSRVVLSAENRQDTIAVCEVSSFQSETFQQWQSDAGIWTHFSPNHLDRHGDLRGYFLAKCKAFAGIPECRLLLGKSVLSAAAKLRLGDQLPSGRTAQDLHLDDNRIPPFLQSAAQRDNLQLAVSLLLTAGVVVDRVMDALPSFVPPQHRLCHVRTVRGIEFWNDSKATNSAAVLAALQQFAGRRIHWIGGGLSKGEDWTQEAAGLAASLGKAYTIGATGEGLARILNDHGIVARYCKTLDRAVDIALQQASAGDLILLSPGFASFDQFDGYADRGESFVKKVFHLSSPEEVVKTMNLTENSLSSNLQDFSQGTEL